MGLADRVALNSALQAARQVFSVVAGTVSVIVSTRYLSIEAYGGVLAAVYVIALFSVASDLGIAGTAVRLIARDPENEAAIRSSAFWTWAALALPTALVILAMTQVLYPGHAHVTTRESVLILMVTFPLMPVAAVAEVQAVLEQRVWLTSLAAIGGRGVGLAGVISAAALGLAPLGIAAAFAAGMVLENLFAILAIRPHVQWRNGPDLTRVRALFLAALPLGIIIAINGMYFNLDAFLLSIMGPERGVAVYGAAYKGFETLTVLPGFVMVTLMPVLSRLNSDDARFQGLVQKAFTAMCLLAVPIFGFSLLGKSAMTLLGGQKYSASGLVLTLVLCSVGCSCIQGVFGYTLVTQSRQGVLLRVSLVVLVFNALVNLIAIPLYGPHGAAAVLLASEVLSLVLTARAYRRVAPLPAVNMPARTLISLVALIAATQIRFVVQGTVLSVLAAFVAGSSAYVLSLWALGAIPSYVSAPVLSLLRLDRLRINARWRSSAHRSAGHL